MAGAWPIDLGFDYLLGQETNIRAAVGSNEDTTRVRAIDSVVFAVVGWSKADVETEKFCSGVGYSDYVFFRDQTISLVLEAKRAEKTFVLPKRAYGERPVSFALICEECPAAEAAMGQAIGYAATLGAKYVAISNGHQWIIALCYVPQQAVRQRSVYVFESFEAIKERFDLFWKCFSPEGLNSNAAADGLIECRKAPPPPKLSTRIVNYPVSADRNVISNELSVVLKILWEDVNNQEDKAFIEECYVTPDSTVGDLAYAKELIDARRKSDELQAAEALEAKHIPDLISDYAPDKPIVLLGRIGHGKSIFLKYLRLVKAQESLKNYIQITIDFIDRPDRREEVGAFCLDQVEDQLEHKHNVVIDEDGFARNVLGYDLNKYRNSVEGKSYAGDDVGFKRSEVLHIVKLQTDRHNYLAKVFRNLRRGRNHSIAVFFDNLDRRNYLIQEEAFLKASAMAREWGCLVFVCLRPSTFYHSKSEGVLDSLAPKTITVASPMLSAVLKRRFNYAKRLAEGENIKGKIGRAAMLDSSLTFDLPRVVDFLECCEKSFTKNKKLTTLFTAVSNGDIREALRHVGDMLVSQHLNTEKILWHIENDKAEYIIADHEAQRALLYRDSLHYEPSESIFINIFDILHADPLEHFSRLLSLQYLSRIGQGPPAHGYCTLQTVVQYLCQLGYSEGHSKETIEFLHSKKCCEPRMPDDAWSTLSGGDIRITARGRYHVSHLVSTFEYVDAVVVDTPITQLPLAQIMADERDIFRRLDRAEAFASYLDDCSNALQDGDAISVWRAIHANLRRDFVLVRESARRMNQRQQGGNRR